MKTFKLLLFTVVFFTCVFTSKAQKNTKRPNIVIILSDDVGFEEFGIYNVTKEPTKTPNIDKLGKVGVTFKSEG